MLQEFAKISRVNSADLLVDSINDLQVSREELLEQADLPFLESFRQDGMAVISFGYTRNLLGVGENLGGDLPSHIVRDVLLVNEDPHELCNDNGWVGIVHCGNQLTPLGIPFSVIAQLTLDTDIVRKLGPRELELSEAPKHILE